MAKNIENPDVYVRFENVTKKFGNFTAVSGVTFDIYKGEVLGFLGPNGAGKSTTMKMIAHLLKPTKGNIWIRGNGKLEKITNRNKDFLLNKIGFLIENPTFYGNMTPRETLTYFGELKGYPHKKIHARVEEIVELVGLSDWIDVKMKGFSKGMRQKIGIVSAIVHDPDIVVLDEPQTGLDPKARIEIREFILKLRDMGKTVFLSSHLLFEVSEVADRVAMINNGKIIALDSLDNLERMAQGSILRLELFNMDEIDKNAMIHRLEKDLYSLTGLKDETGFISYNVNSDEFDILFNGDSKNQLAIFKMLGMKNYDVIGFSVPKADLLEDLYLKFMKEDTITADASSHEQLKGEIQV
jgi:ABC-2 type transport system ATP-binding protein